MIESDLYEMSNLSSKTTGLASNIIIWVRTDPLEHGHSRYRLKVTKDRMWTAIFTVSSTPTMVKDINQSLTIKETNSIIEWIETYYPLIISLIDGKIDTAEFSYELHRTKG